MTNEASRQVSYTMEVRDLHFSYTEGVEVLHGVNLGFDGRSCAIVGQNGAGKTTLVKLLKGLLRPTQGMVLLHGQDIAGTSVPELARHVGLVFQNPNDQIFKNTVLDEVMFGPLQIGMEPGGAKKASLAALEQVGLSGLEGKPLRPGAFTAQDGVGGGNPGHGPAGDYSGRAHHCSGLRGQGPT